MIKSDVPFRDVSFAFLDTETTGLSPRYGGRVCEIAILTIQNGEKKAFFQSLINPEGPIDAGAVRVHGITEEMVAQEPTFGELAPKILAEIEGKVLVCHNAPFDVSFLRSEFDRAGRDMPEIKVLDTLRLARKHFKFERNNLGQIAKELGVKVAGWHRAGNDVMILHQVFRSFLRSFQSKGVSTLEGLLKL